MNKKYLALVLPLLLITSCGQTGNPTSEPTTETPSVLKEAQPAVDINEVISNLLNNVNVKVTGVEKNVYPTGYELYNTVNKINVDRDYAKIVEADGSVTPAVRDNLDPSFRTYLKAKDGGTIYEMLEADNTVKEYEYRINYNKVLFNEKFGNPFEYLDFSDITIDGDVNLVKTNFIVELLTGLSVAPKSAKMTFEGNRAKSIEIETYTRYDMIETSAAPIMIESTYDLTIEFSYDVAEIKHLQPRSNADEHITSALSNKLNYTLTFKTDLFLAATTIYVTEEAIYVQNDNKSVGPSDGDTYFKKVGNAYESYVYKSSVGKFNIDELSVDVKYILPDLTTINPNILTHESGSVYLIEQVAALNSLDNFVIPSYVIGDGYGINGTVILDENNNIAQFRGSFMPESQFNIIQNYYNYGTTSMPSWLDVANIK